MDQKALVQLNVADVTDMAATPLNLNFNESLVDPRPGFDGEKGNAEHKLLSTDVDIDSTDNHGYHELASKNGKHGGFHIDESSLAPAPAQLTPENDLDLASFVLIPDEPVLYHKPSSTEVDTASADNHGQPDLAMNDDAVEPSIAPTQLAPEKDLDLASSIVAPNEPVLYRLDNDHTPMQDISPQPLECQQIIEGILGVNLRGPADLGDISGLHGFDGNCFDEEVVNGLVAPEVGETKIATTFLTPFCSGSSQLWEPSTAQVSVPSHREAQNQSAALQDEETDGPSYVPQSRPQGRSYKPNPKRQRSESAPKPSQKKQETIQISSEDLRVKVAFAIASLRLSGVSKARKIPKVQTLSFPLLDGPLDQTKGFKARDRTTYLQTFPKTAMTIQVRLLIEWVDEQHQKLFVTSLARQLSEEKELVAVSFGRGLGFHLLHAFHRSRSELYRFASRLMFSISTLCETASQKVLHEIAQGMMEQLSEVSKQGLLESARGVVDNIYFITRSLQVLITSPRSTIVTNQTPQLQRIAELHRTVVAFVDASQARVHLGGDKLDLIHLKLLDLASGPAS